MLEYNTPCGALRCCDETGASVSFEVAALDEKHQERAEVYDDVLEEWFPVEITKYEISIASKDLLSGNTYILKLPDGLKCSYGNADEFTMSNAVSSDGVSLSLGAYDPNDAEKDRQAVPVYEQGQIVGCTAPPDYDTSRFEGYLLEYLDDFSGFRFCLIDHSIPLIRFKIAWVYHTRKVRAEYYEDAVAWTALFRGNNGSV